MKKVARSFHLLKFGLGLILISACANNPPGPASSGGGDIAVAEFNKLSKNLSIIFLDEDTHTDSGFEPSKFKESIEVTKVTSATSLFLGTQVVDAINNPDDKTIQINQERWLALKWDEKIKLQIHEFLGILRIEDKQYELSSQLTQVALPRLNDRLELLPKLEKMVAGTYFSSNELFPTFVATYSGGKPVISGKIYFKKADGSNISADAILNCRGCETDISSEGKRMFSFWGNFSIPCTNGYVLNTWVSLYLVPRGNSYREDLEANLIFPDNISLGECKAGNGALSHHLVGSYSLVSE